MQKIELGSIKVDRLLDVRGLTCPQPLLRSKKAFEFLESGEVMEVHGTCPGSKSSFPQWAERTGNEFLGMVEEVGYSRFFLKKR